MNVLNIICDMWDCIYNNNEECKKGQVDICGLTCADYEEKEDE